MKFLIALFRDENYDPEKENEIMREEINRLNQAMIDAGIRIFVGGLHPPSNAVSVQYNKDTGVVVAKCPHLSKVDYISGFWVIEACDLNAAVTWGKKAAAACRGDIEVRPFH